MRRRLSIPIVFAALSLAVGTASRQANAVRPAERAERGAAPGLLFASQQKSWKLKKDREQVIEFVAERLGIYRFKCSVFCGLGHRRMKGRLIVEE